MKIESFRRPPGERFHLAEIDPRGAGKLRRKDAEERLAANRVRLQRLHQRLYAEGKHGLLIVLQAMDTGGKDGVIRHVLEAFDPQSVAVTSFKVPTPEELSHDFLWRVHKAVPGRGMAGIFNRSHYEDVLVVRVRKLVPDRVWRARYEQINAFEKMLAANGVTLVKLFLHLSPDEQAERLRDRQTDPEEKWKFNPGDLDERRRWASYMAAYEDALAKCNTPWAPWYVVPADRKWYRNLVVSEILIAVLEGLDLQYPEPEEDITSYEIPAVEWP